MARLCGATLGLFAFSVTIFLSLAAQNSIEETLWRALSAMLCFCGIGLAAGWVATRVLDEYALWRHIELFGEEETTEVNPPAEKVEAGEDVTKLKAVTS
jgi:hypothetical protein